MSEPDHDSGSKDRATVALVYRTVDDLSKLVDAHFETVNAKLDAQKDIPRRVESLERTALDHERRLLVGERDREALADTAEQAVRDRSMWRKVHFPTLLISLAALALSAFIAFH